jgi:hypothetical protein
MSKISLEGNVSGSGTLTIAAPNTNSNFTLSLPTNTGTIITQNSTPAFASTIGVGGATAAASGAGITFPATQSASSDANTLDDYEEGTWTPAYGDLGGPVGTTTVDGAVYRKIGNLVVATCDITLTTKGTTTGGDLALIHGLPFTAISAVSGIGGASVDFFATLNQNITYISGTQQGDTTILLRITTSATTGTSNGTYSGLYASGTRLFLTIVYMTP